MTKFEQIFGNRIVKNEPMSQHSTLRVGGPAKYFLVGKTVEDIRNAIAAVREDHIPYVCIGGGSNILVSDFGFDGLVIQMNLAEIKIDGVKIYAEAGVFSASLARRAGEAGLSGIEWMATLPGTIGGAVYGNAGAYGEETGNKLARVLTIAEGQEQWVNKIDCLFGYRSSKFKSGRAIILGAEFGLAPGDKEEIKQKMNMFLEKRKNEQPLGASSAGCIFKNYEVGARALSEVEKNFEKSDLAALKDFWAKGRVPAGFLIDRAGLKGFCMEKVCVSDRHGNFSINTGGATADHLVKLISAVKMNVMSKFGIELREEIQYIGF